MFAHTRRVWLSGKSYRGKNDEDIIKSHILHKPYSGKNTQQDKDNSKDCEAELESDQSMVVLLKPQYLQRTT